MNTDYKITSHSLSKFKILGSYGYPLNDNDCWKRVLTFISRVLYRDSPEDARRAMGIFAIPMYGHKEIEWYVPTEIYGYKPKIKKLTDYDNDKQEEFSNQLICIIGNIRTRAYRLLNEKKVSNKAFDDQRLYISFVYDDTRDYKYGCALSFDDQNDIYVINDMYPIIAGWGLKNLSKKNQNSIFYRTYDKEFDEEKLKDKEVDLDLNLDTINFVPFPAEKNNKVEPEIVYQVSDAQIYIPNNENNAQSDNPMKSDVHADDSHEGNKDIETDADTGVDNLHAESQINGDFKENFTDDDSGRNSNSGIRLNAGIPDADLNVNFDSPDISAGFSGDSFGGFKPSRKNDDAFYANQKSFNTREAHYEKESSYEKENISDGHRFNKWWIIIITLIILLLLALLLLSLFGNKSFIPYLNNFINGQPQSGSIPVRSGNSQLLVSDSAYDSNRIVDLDELSSQGAGNAVKLNEQVFTNDTNNSDHGNAGLSPNGIISEQTGDLRSNLNGRETDHDDSDSSLSHANVNDKGGTDNSAAGNDIKMIDPDAPKDNYIIDNTTGEKVDYNDVVKNTKIHNNQDDSEVVNLDENKEPVPCYFADFEIDLSAKSENNQQIIYSYQVSHQSNRRVTFSIKKNGNLIDCGAAGVMNNPDYKVNFDLKCNDENVKRLPNVSCDFSIPSCKGLLLESGLSINMHPSQVSACTK